MDPLNPPVLPQDPKERALLIRQLCDALRKNPAFAWFLAAMEEKHGAELATVVNESLKGKERTRATHRYNLLGEVCGWVEDQDREAINTIRDTK